MTSTEMFALSAVSRPALTTVQLSSPSSPSRRGSGDQVTRPGGIARSTSGSTVQTRSTHPLSEGYHSDLHQSLTS